MRTAYRGGVLVLAGLSTFGLVGCPNDYTCADYADCNYDAGLDAAHATDARGDTSQVHHDAGLDATTDGHITKETGASEVGTPDVVVVVDAP